MEEVDKIIFRVLHQVDSTIDINGKLTDFTPDHIVHAVACCLTRINPTICTNAGRELPAALTQKFSIATSLAEACKKVGYMNEIGYNTFLYPNTGELRRLLMFLIEKLPRELTSDEQHLNGAGGNGNEVERIISDALNDLSKTHNALIKNYGRMAIAQPTPRKPKTKMKDHANPAGNMSVTSDDVKEDIVEEDPAHTELIDSEKRAVQELSAQISTLFHSYKTQEETLNQLRREEKEAQAELDSMMPLAKRQERTAKVLQDHETNVSLLKESIATTREKETLIAARYEELQTTVAECKQAVAAQLQEDASGVLAKKIQVEHLEAQLLALNEVGLRLKRLSEARPLDAPTRKVYIHRLHESIKNLSKQQKDIDGVLGKSLELQKAYNTIGAQVERQFNYTEDLLYKNALYSTHAKKSYRLLAELHSHCKQLEELVSTSGALGKELRELEEQIEKEKLKNVAHSMRQINVDIEQSEYLIQELHGELVRLESTTSLS